MKIEFTAQPMLSKGASTPAVARTVPQARVLLDAFPVPTPPREEVLNVSMTLMKHLVACEEARERIGAQVTKGRMAVDSGAIAVERGRLLRAAWRHESLL